MDAEHREEHIVSQGNESSESNSSVLLKHLDENHLFTEYYMIQNILTSEELSQFCEYIRKPPLSCNFHISNQSSVSRRNVLTQLKEFISSASKENDNIVSCLSWLEDESRWQLKTSFLSEWPLNQFITQQLACGNLHESDAVGLIPVLLMDLKSHHKVLDTQAMKTMHIFNMMHNSPHTISDGMIVVSDKLFKNFTNRNMSSDALYKNYIDLKLSNPMLAVLQLDPANLPGLQIDSQTGMKEMLKYDRILCDIPSSNDGMFRGNLESLREWSPVIATEYHSRMCRRLQSATCQLAVNGRLVFCTYSMNPIENEAVVAKILTQQKGSVQLVDVSSILPDRLQYKSGLKHWKVMTKHGHCIDKFSELIPIQKNQFRESMFAPAADIADSYHLEYCVRILPHQQDTDGLFVAVIQRIRSLEEVLQEERESAIKAEREKDEKQQDATSDMKDTTATEAGSVEMEVGEKGVVQVDSDLKEKRKVVSETEKSDEVLNDDINSKAKRSVHCLLPDDTLTVKKSRSSILSSDRQYQFLKMDDDIWITIRNTFGISSEFPVDQLLLKGNDKSCIYLVSSTVQQMIELNQSSINIMHVGVKLFCRMSSRQSECNYRITHEGLPYIIEFIHKQRINLTASEFVDVLKCPMIDIDCLSNATRRSFNQIQKGGVVLVCPVNDSKRSENDDKLMTTGWYDGQRQFQSFITQSNRQHFIHIINETSISHLHHDDDNESSWTTVKNSLNTFSQSLLALER